MNNFKAKIGYSLLLNILLIIFLMIILAGFSFTIFMQKNVESELNSRLYAENHFAIKQIENLFINSTHYVEQLSLNKKILDFFDDVDNRDEIRTHPEYENIINLMESIKESNYQIFLVWIASENPNYYLDHTRTLSDEAYDVFIRPWYQVAMKPNKVNYSNPYIEYDTKEIVVSTIKTLKEDDGTHNFIVADFSINTVPEVVSTINVGEKGQVFIIDEEGQYIYHDNEAWILNENINTTMPELTKYLKASNHDLKLINLNGESYYMMSQSIDYSNWSIITLMNKSEVIHDLRRFTLLLLGGLFILTTISMIVIIMRVRKKLSPMKDLSTYSQKIADGDFKAKPPYEIALRTDEMGSLAKSFVTIAEVFKEQNEMLTETINIQYEEIKQQYSYIIEKEKIASLAALVTGVSHEINTPLGNTITTSSYIQETINDLREKFDNKTLSHKDFLNRMDNLQDACERLLINLKKTSDLINEFKTISYNQKTESHQNIVLYEAIDLIIKNIQARKNNKNIEIVNKVNKNIQMITYPGAISQLINNLIINSLEHGFDDKDSGSITISAIKEEQLVRLTYEDNGKGIPKEIINHIFEPFYTTNRSNSNSGLGMFIVHNLIYQTLSGVMKCSSQPGQGVHFEVTLPLVLSDKDPTTR